MEATSELLIGMSESISILCDEIECLKAALLVKDFRLQQLEAKLDRLQGGNNVQ